MDTVTLGYTSGLNTYTREFDIFSVRYLDVEFEKRVVKCLDSSYKERVVGYRKKTHVEFYPLLDDREALYFLYGFLIGTSRTILGTDFTSRSVTITGTNVDFQFMEAKFGNAFTLDFVDSAITTVVDDGSTKTMIVSYDPHDRNTTDTFYCDLIDDSSVEVRGMVFKPDLSWRKDVVWGYSHKIKINLGYVQAQTQRDWLLEFLCWGHKQIDCSALDSLNGKVFDVVFVDNELNWEFSEGVKTALSTSLNFKERVARLVAEDYQEPAGTPFVIDEKEADSVPIGA